MNKPFAHFILTIALGAGLTFIPVLAQTPDGALVVPDNTFMILDPVGKSLDIDGDNVYNFTSVSIGQNSTLRLKASKMRKNAGVVFVVSGDVTIGFAGSININGDDGDVLVQPGQLSRRPSDPGPGGYPGGVGSRTDTAASAAGDGFGPAGSRGIAETIGCATVVTTNASNNHMNLSMIPLVGGAGGAGGYCASFPFGGNGGAGGGALRIVAAGTISMANSATITANGGAGSGINGNGPAAGRGSGGMIHLIAPTITFGLNNKLSAETTGTSEQVPLKNGAGVIRLNATTVNGLAQVQTLPTAIQGPLYSIPLPSGIPEVVISKVDGLNVAVPPSGLITGADVVINNPNPVQVLLNAKNIPVGTAVTLRLNSENVADQTVTCPGLTGTLAASTTTCTATFPLGANLSVASLSW